MQRDEQAVAVRHEEQKEAVQEGYLKWAAQKLHQVQLSRLPVCCTTLHGLYCAVPHCMDSSVLCHIAIAWTLLCCTTLYGLFSHIVEAVFTAVVMVGL